MEASGPDALGVNASAEASVEDSAQASAAASEEAWKFKIRSEGILGVLV